MNVEYGVDESWLWGDERENGFI